jgi:hypothetical protein
MDITGARLMKMTFTCEHHHELLISKPLLSKITYETNQVELSNILQDFESFLRGAGFTFDGCLDIVPFDEGFSDEDYSMEQGFDGHEGMGSTLADYPELKHSSHYFDTERNK